MTKEEWQKLADHVGCGDFDSMVGCPTCNMIREMLWRLQQLNDED